MNTHSLKILPEYFKSVLDGSKTFEIRNNDRCFKVGDLITLREYIPDIRKYTGRSIQGEITYLTNFEQKNDYVVFSFQVVNK